jgi:hypothetical protein
MRACNKPLARTVHRHVDILARKDYILVGHRWRRPLEQGQHNVTRYDAPLRNTRSR